MRMIKNSTIFLSILKSVTFSKKKSYKSYSFHRLMTFLDLLNYNPKNESEEKIISFSRKSINF